MAKKIDKLAIGKSIHDLAMSFAAKTATAIDLAVVTAADAKYEFSLGPVKLYNAIHANLSAEDIAMLPQPGSKYSDPGMTDDDGKLISNRIPDISEWKDPSAKVDAKPKEISFYVVWADNTPEGAHVVKELEWCSRINKPNVILDDIPQEWRNKYASNPTALSKREKYLNARRGTVRKAYKDAVRLLWQLDLVNELEGCVAELGSMDDNTVIVSNKLKPKEEWKLHSVGSFLKLDPLKASESDGSYAALEATAKRTPVPGGQTGLKLNAVATPESSDLVATVWHSYLDKAMSDRKGDTYAALLKHLTSDSGKQALLTMGGIRHVLNELFKMDVIQTRYDIEREKVAKAA